MDKISKMEYDITACPVYKGIGLCNQLCLVLNALEQAFQVISLGVGVVVKTNIQSAHYGGQLLDKYPSYGYQWVDNQTLLDGHDPMPFDVKYLDICWKNDVRTCVSRYKEKTLVHWLDANPSSVCVYIDSMIADYLDMDTKTPYTEVLDLDSINQSLRPFRIRLEYQESHKSPNSLYYMGGTNTPRTTPLFHTLISMLRFQPCFYENVSTWLGEREPAHVIHLRNEEDAIRYWSCLYGAGLEEKLTIMYKQNIRLYIKKDKLTIILTSWKENNPIIQWMMEEGYMLDVYKPEKAVGREISAVYDLVLATFCRNVFIGLCNPECTDISSTFSYFISHMLPKHVHKVLIDINNVIH